MGPEALADRFGEHTCRWLRRALLWTGGLALLTCIVLGTRYVAATRAVELETRDKLLAIATEAAARMDRILEPVRSASTGLAARLSRGELGPADVEPALRAMVNSNDGFYGGTVAYRPWGHDRHTRLYAPYFRRQAGPGGGAPVQLADDYDYTERDPGPGSKTAWYTRPMDAAGQDGWSPPYFDPSLTTSMITYSAVFMTPGDKPEKNGVVTIDVSMDQLRQVIRGLALGPGGFGALTTSDGTYLYHPDPRLVREGKTLADIARERHDPDRLALAAAAAARQSGVLRHLSTTTGEKAWLAYAPVPGTGWSLQITFVRNDVPTQVEQLRRQLIWITVSAIALLACAALLLLRVHEGRTPRLWAGTAALSVLLLAGIGCIWYLALNHHGSPQGTDQAGDAIAITAREVLQQQKARYDALRREKKQPPVQYVPTGLHIEALELDGGNKLSVMGQIWQTFPAGAAPGPGRGVVFRGAQDVKITPIDTQPDAASGLVVQRSRFEFDLVTLFDYSRYPLEIERIAIGLGPVERQGAQVLVPDLDAYNIALASHRPGLAAEVRIPGWSIESASFVLRPRNENSRFGLETGVDQEVFPELVYEIGLKRVFVDAFISNLTPLIVVAIVLFWLLLLPQSVEIKEVLGFCVSLFFVVVFAHLSIRRQIASGQIFYLEYFFLVTYFALLAVPVNAFRRALQLPVPLLEYRGGLVSKVLYWPLMLGVFFLITVLKFY